jgi:hypothetical protein
MRKTAQYARGVPEQQAHLTAEAVRIRHGEQSLGAVDFNPRQVGTPDIETGDDGTDRATFKIHQSGHVSGHIHLDGFLRTWLRW